MINIVVQDAGLLQLIKQIKERGNDMTPAMKIIAGYMKESVNLNFDSEGRPRWPALAPSTIAAREKAGHWPGKMLVSGAQGGLKESITQRATATQAIVGTNKKYAAIHQFGGSAGRGRKVKIPPRPYLSLTPEDIENIKQELSDWLLKQK